MSIIQLNDIALNTGWYSHGDLSVPHLEVKTESCFGRQKNLIVYGAILFNNNLDSFINRDFLILSRVTEVLKHMH